MRQYNTRKRARDEAAEKNEVEAGEEPKRNKQQPPPRSVGYYSKVGSVKFNLFLEHGEQSDGTKKVEKAKFELAFDEFPRTSAGLVSFIEQQLVELSLGKVDRKTTPMTHLIIDFFKVDGTGSYGKKMFPREVVYAVRATIGKTYPPFNVLGLMATNPPPYVNISFQYDDNYTTDFIARHGQRRITIKDVELRLAHVPDDDTIFSSDLLAHITQELQPSKTWEWKVDLNNDLRLQIFWLKGKGSESEFNVLTDLAKLRKDVNARVPKMQRILVRACAYPKRIE